MTDGKMLDRQTILAASDLPQETEPVPEWEGEVIVRGLTATDRDAYEESIYKFREEGGKAKASMSLINARATLVVRCLIDEDGKRLFSDADAVALGKKSSVVVDRLYEVARRLSGMSDGDIEELAGNSETAPSEDSPSD